MLKTITWSNYLIIISILLFIWYSVTGFIYYRKELRLLVTGKSPLLPARLKKPDDRLLVELSATIHLAAANFFSKEDLLHTLTEKLAGHTINKAILQFITHESKETCSIHFGEEDLRVLLKNK